MVKITPKTPPNHANSIIEFDTSSSTPQQSGETTKITKEATATEYDEKHNKEHEKRKGLLRNVLLNKVTKLAPKFSSQPLACSDSYDMSSSDVDKQDYGRSNSLCIEEVLSSSPLQNDSKDDSPKKGVSRFAAKFSSKPLNGTDNAGKNDHCRTNSLLMQSTSSISQPTINNDSQEVHTNDKHANGVARFAAKFSSQPIGGADSSSGSTKDYKRNNSLLLQSTSSKSQLNNNSERKASISNDVNSISSLTPHEEEYIERILNCDDPDAIRMASERISNQNVFPILHHDENDDATRDDIDEEYNLEEENEKTDNNKSLGRRESRLQQGLYRFHEETEVRPSVLIKQLSISRDISTNSNNKSDKEKVKSDTIEVDTTNKSSEKSETSISDTTDEDFDDLMLNVESWIESSQGIEVDSHGSPLERRESRSLSSIFGGPSFKILGTYANDISCHPHVLTPPIMEALQSFMPESLTSNHNFWLKYSLVRDSSRSGPGKSGILRLLQHARGSNNTIIGVETTCGRVFGSFTTMPWRLSNGYYGSKESFVWRLRHSRLKECDNMAEQISNESDLEIFPYTSSNNAIQHCSRKRISIGSYELLQEKSEEGITTIGNDEEQQHGYNLSSTSSIPEIPSADSNSTTYSTIGKHYGSAITISSSLRYGTTSTTKTFNNPCLTDTEKRGDKFEILNLEVWTLTPHGSIEDAQNDELSKLFFEETHEKQQKKLNLLNIALPTPLYDGHVQT